jgi:prephenate dehydrogenase
LCILTPHPQTHSDTIARVSRFWRSLGMKVVRMTPLEHDQRMALASHLPQAVASVLMSVQTAKSLAVAGQGLMDTTRLAASDGRLWAEILLDNRRAVSQALAGVTGRLVALRQAIESGDATSIRRMFASAARGRERLVRRDRRSKP